PYINQLELAAELNRMPFPGVNFVPIQFTPDSSKFDGYLCNGVNILLTERDADSPVNLGIAIAHTLHRLYREDYDIDAFNRLLRHPEVIEKIKAGYSWQPIVESWRSEVPAFEERRKPYLLY
ncbi:MAG: DUF1343 domain-containing protein, partial [Verrucomicrobiae bacterium]|nr:DUF1343 domain-containing protein [Verrucomicrobiae bacterium]